jgi:hypothetical protein
MTFNGKTNPNAVGGELSGAGNSGDGGSFGTSVPSRDER